MPVYHTAAGPVEMLEWGSGEELWLLLHAAAAGPKSLSGLAEAAADLSGPTLLIVGEAMALAQASDGQDMAEALIRQARA